MKKKYIILFSALVLGVAAPISTFADELDAKIQQQESTINTIKNKKSETEKLIATLDKEIAEIQVKADDLLEKKVTVEAEVHDLTNEIDALIIAIDKRTEKIEDQARATQINQSKQSFVSMMLESESVSDAIKKSFAYGKLIQANNDIANAQKEDKETLDKKKTEVEEKLVQINKLTEKLKIQKDALNEKKIQQAIVANELAASLATEESKKNMYLKQKEEAEKRRVEAAKIAKIQAENAKKARLLAEANTGSLASTFVSGNSSSSNVMLPPTSSGDFQRPLASYVITSPFGYREDPNGFSGNGHDGIDLAAPAGSSVYASRGGKVVQVGFDGSAGNHIIVQHDNGYYTYYLHLTRYLVSQGESVAAGQQIGLVGSTGNSTGPHLHFGVASTPNWRGFINPTSVCSL